MVLYFKINLKEVIRLEKKYPWSKPEFCPKCGGRRLWGHGYVWRCFDGVDEGVWIKRWRCAECGGVHTCRPEGYWRGFWAHCETIVLSMTHKLREGCWQKELGRQRQQYWWQGLKKQWFQFPERCFSQGSVLNEKGLKQMLLFGIIVTTHSVMSFLL